MAHHDNRLHASPERWVFRYRPCAGIAISISIAATLAAADVNPGDSRTAGIDRAKANRPTPAVELYPRPPRDPAERVALAHAQAADAKLVRLKSSVFDPLRHGVPDFSAVLPRGPVLRRPAPDGLRFLVQLHGSVTATAKRRLRERGIELLGHVPNRTLLVRLPADLSAERLRSAPDVRWVGPFLSGYKLSPALYRTIREGTDDALLTLDAILFREEDPDLLASAVEKRFETARIEFTRRRQPPRITIGLPASELERLVGALVRDPAVEFVSRRSALELHNDNSVWIGQSYDRINGPGEALASDPKPYTASATIWNQGLTGAGQIIAVADTGLEPGTCFFEDPAHAVVPQSVPPPGDLVVHEDHRKVLAYNATLPNAFDFDDSFRHGTHTSASAAGDSLANPANLSSAGHDHGDGMAPGAKIIFEDVSGGIGAVCATTIVVNSVEDLLLQEYNAGARISTNSWGSSGEGEDFDATSFEMDSAFWEMEDFAVFFSAGNNGGDGLVGQAACKNCIAVGASENYDGTHNDEFGILDPENMAAFSSRGPTTDGRLKPDIVAPGFRVHSARFPVEYFPDEGDPVCDPRDPEVCLPNFGGCYVTDTSETCNVDPLSGTSMASPLAAGLGALVRQYFTDGFHPTGEANPADARVPSAALIKALMINGARNMTGRLYDRRNMPQDFGPLADAPSNVQGWGRVMLDDVLYFAGESRRLLLVDVPNATGLNTGEAVRAHFTVAGPAEPLKLTLVWTDAPGQASASGALVDDLDLELAAPDGTIYRGNQWTADDINVPGDKQSLPDPVGRDAVNNVEGILIPSPSAGLWTVEIQGIDVPGSVGISSQGGALAVTGAVAECTAESAPQNLVVQGFSSSQVELAWDPVPGALGYTLLRNSSDCSEPMAADLTTSIPAGQTDHVDTDVRPISRYNYTVRAVVSAAGCETADSNCVSVLAINHVPPPPVPDGSFGSPMTAAKGDAEATVIDLEWDAASCPPDGRHILFGPLAEVADYTVNGSVCDLDGSGMHSWSGVPAADLWFLVVSDDTGLIEGSWGSRSDGAGRAGSEASGQCGFVLRDNSGDCVGGLP